MSIHPLRITPSAMFRARDLQAIEESAVRMLEELGIEVTHPALVARAQRKGFRPEQGRIRLSRRQVKSFLEEERGGRPLHRRRTAPRAADRSPLKMCVSGYPDHFHDPETNEIVPLTTARLIEATKLVGMLGDRGLIPNVPGYPVDVPAPLQPVLQYRIGIENLPNYSEVVDHKDLVSFPYVMEMAEVLGRPIRVLNMYVVSPLEMAGESLNAVMKLESRIDEVYVTSYPTVGCTGPVRPAETFALAVAEVLGSALILRECLEVKVAWEVAAYSFDLRGLAMSYGSPEGLLLEIASREVNAYFHGERWWPHLYNTGSTLAKLPDPQAAAEKMSYMTMAALWGATVLPFAGCLSYSEVFSPMQLLADLEMKDHVERLVHGLDTGCDPEACLEDVRAGMESGFIGLDRTVALYRDLYWHPRLFERRFLGPWKSDSCPSFERRAREMIRLLVASHDYEPAADVRKEIGRIYRRAEQELASASPTSE